ncbi:MAG: helix-turn-helix transcriptional regulator [Gordonia sp. (in: high G+C Gram-positive bacteria)]|uniref:helix-turn-helix domain-containing protein n=1 Tax=Gordonia TaxID=2053 RepID=UPI0032662E42
MSDADPRPPTLGELIRTQRELAALPMRKLAEMVGISNPYLSQIERNLREPSDRVLEAIAHNLHLSADSLAASARPSDPEGQPEVVAAIRRDPDLTRAQRAALEEMYETFRGVTVANRRRGDG